MFLSLIITLFLYYIQSYKGVELFTQIIQLNLNDIFIKSILVCMVFTIDQYISLILLSKYSNRSAFEIIESESSDSYKKNYYQIWISALLLIIFFGIIKVTDPYLNTFLTLNIIIAYISVGIECDKLLQGKL